MRFVFVPIESVTQGMINEIRAGGLHCTFDSLTKDPTGKFVMLKSPDAKPTGTEIYKSYDEAEAKDVLASDAFKNGTLEVEHTKSEVMVP